MGPAKVSENKSPATRTSKRRSSQSDDEDVMRPEFWLAMANETEDADEQSLAGDWQTR